MIVIVVVFVNNNCYCGSDSGCVLLTITVTVIVTVVVFVNNNSYCDSDSDHAWSVIVTVVVSVIIMCRCTLLLLNMFIHCTGSITMQATQSLWLCHLVDVSLYVVAGRAAGKQRQRPQTADRH